MKVICTSDTHGYSFGSLSLPQADLFIHAGDASINSATAMQFLNTQIGLVPCKHKIYVPGNHDGYIYKKPYQAKKLLTNAHLLIDEEIVIDGLRIYGTPWTPEFCGWYFMHPKGSEALLRLREKIPENPDILIAHGPPFGILDLNEEGMRTGCDLLRSEIDNRIKPRYMVMGHIHECYGVKMAYGEATTFINASFVDVRLRPKNEPIVLDITPITGNNYD